MLAPVVTYSIALLSSEPLPGGSDSDIVGLTGGGFADAATGNFSSGPGVFTGTYDAAGNPLGGIVIAGVSQSAVAQLTDGNIVTAATQSLGGIHYSIISSSGSVGGGLIGNSTTQSHPDVAALTGGGFVVVDQKSASSTANFIEVHIRDAGGSDVTDFNVLAPAAADENATVIGLADGGFAVAWDRVAPDLSTSVWFAVYNANGSPQKAPTQFDSTGSINKEVNVTALPSGGFAVAYEDSGWDNSQPDITVAVFNAAGTLQHFSRASSLSTGDSGAAVTTLSDGLVLTTFTNDHNGDGSDIDILGTLIDPTAVTALSDPAHPFAPAFTAHNEEDSSVSALSRFSQFVLSYTDQTTGTIDEKTFQLVRTTHGINGQDTIVGDDAVDHINGDLGADTLTGGANADTFVFDTTALTDAQSGVFDTITDYDRGNTGIYSDAGEGDQIDLSALLSVAYNHGSGQPVGSLVRAVVNGTGADLQIDTDGAANGANWLTIAHLDGIFFGSSVNVILDGSLPAGTNISLPSFPFTGVADILWQNDSGQAAVWQMNGTIPVTQVAVGGNPGPAWHVKDAGDFNGDGTPDILWQNDSGQAAVWLMFGGDGTTPVSEVAVGGNPGPAWHVKAAADFNHDGHSDILWQNDSGQAAIWLIGQDGTTPVNQVAVGGNPGPAWHVIAAADFNGDQTPDILWQNDSGQAAIWLMFGGDGITPVLQAAAGGNPGPAWHVKAAADFNHDGHADILWQNDSGQAAIWLMNGTNPVSEVAVGGNPGSAWHVKEAVDFNGDGTPDILWQNDNGQAAIWLMFGGNGTIPVSEVAVGANPGTDWHVIA